MELLSRFELESMSRGVSSFAYGKRKTFKTRRL